jgi:hypothetical protein
VSVHDGDPFLGKVSGPAQRDARCDEEAACSADYDEAGSTGLLDALDEAIRSADDLTSVVRRGPIGRDDGVRALDDAGGLRRITKVVLNCGDVLELLHLLWSTGLMKLRVVRILSSSFRKLRRNLKLPGLAQFRIGSPSLHRRLQIT